MPQPNDLSRSLVALDQNSTIIAVVELSQSSWRRTFAKAATESLKNMVPKRENVSSKLSGGNGWTEASATMTLPVGLLRADIDHAGRQAGAARSAGSNRAVLDRAV